MPLKRVVELALSHGTAGAIANADQKRFMAQYLEVRNQYIPQLIAGAGLGWSDGFPLSLEGAAPSLFNVNAQSALLNPALRDFIHAAGTDYKASALRSKDQRNQIIQDAVLSYVELMKCQRRLDRLREAEAAAEKMETAVAQRVKEGVDSETDGKKARLSAGPLSPAHRGSFRLRRRAARASRQTHRASRSFDRTRSRYPARTPVGENRRTLSRMEARGVKGCAEC